MKTKIESALELLRKNGHSPLNLNIIKEKVMEALNKQLKMLDIDYISYEIISLVEQMYLSQRCYTISIKALQYDSDYLLNLREDGILMFCTGVDRMSKSEVFFTCDLYI